MCRLGAVGGSACGRWQGLCVADIRKRGCGAGGFALILANDFFEHGAWCGWGLFGCGIRSFFTAPAWRDFQVKPSHHLRRHPQGFWVPLARASPQERSRPKVPVSKQEPAWEPESVRQPPVPARESAVHPLPPAARPAMRRSVRSRCWRNCCLGNPSWRGDRKLPPCPNPPRHGQYRLVKSSHTER